MKLASVVCSAALLASGLVFGNLAIGEARAFTLDTQANQQPNGTARFQDPDNAFQSNARTPDSNKTGFHFNITGGNNTNGSGVQSRFLPSANGALASPFDQSDIRLTPKPLTQDDR